MRLHMMPKIHARLLTVAAILACLCSLALADDSSITVDKARFTIITPNLIRMEYDDAGAFTDRPTLFAYNRSARFDGAKIVRASDSISIDTGIMTVTYAPNGKPFSPANLNADVHAPGKSAKWTLGDPNPGNLGGTNRTLDTVTGPVPIRPGIISRDGWALVDDSGSPVLTQDWVESRPSQTEQDWYLFGYGLDYRAALKSLAAISGPVPLPRKYQFGIWYSRYWPYNSAEFRQIVQQYDQHGFPLDVIVMDMDWHITQLQTPDAKHGFNGQIWTGYTWDRKLLPDAEELLKWFHSQGLAVTLNDHPADGVQPHEAMYGDFMRAMGADPASGKTLPFDAGSRKYLDTFYQYTHLPHQREGVDFWWLDWQQYPFTRGIPTLTNLAWLNHYNFLETSADGKRGASFSRWAGWGDQKYPIHFSGDANTNWPMLAFEIPFTSTAGNMGCFFWSHDIGGHMGGRNEESYTRWCQFGALSAVLRSHSTRNATMDRRPWTYPQWAEDSMRISFRLRSRLFPYIYTSAAESCTQSVPLLRPMYLDHPDLESAYHNAQQYYFGDNILVAPITMPGLGPKRLAWQTVWFPPGDGPWYNDFTGERYEPGSDAVIACDINQFPLFFRAGAPIPMQPYTHRPGTAPLNHLIVRCYPGDENHRQTSTLYEDDGQSQAHESGQSAVTILTYNRIASQGTITLSSARGQYAGQPQTRAYTIELPALQKPASATVDGAPAPFAYDASTATATIEIPARPITTPVLLTINAAPVDPKIIHQQSIADRLSGILGRPITPGPILEMLKSALDESPLALQPAILAAAGAAVVLHNDAPYLYNGRESYRLYQFPSLIDPQTAAAHLVWPDGGSAAAAPFQFASGSALPIDLKSNLTDEQTIYVAGKEPALAIDAQFAGRLVEFLAPIHGPLPADTDLARQATVTANSTAKWSDPRRAIDGIADGWPDSDAHEWASAEKTPALTLAWSRDQSVSHILLYDRRDGGDHVLAGRIVFSNGDALPFGEPPKDGQTPADLHFPAKTVRWLRIEITRVTDSTENAGLSEVAAFR